ncbi:hypothetical protein AAG906_001739 [Vitis piasezkii]
MPRHGSNLTQVDRNAVERERRMYMKELFSRLAFLIPTRPFKVSLPELLDQAITHVKQSKERVEMLKQRKQLVEGNPDMTGGTGSRSSVIAVCDLGSILQVCLTSGLNKKFMLYQVIDVLVEEAAEVVALSYSIVDDKIFYTISVQAVSSRIGIETSRVQERLTELIFQTTC